MKQLRPEPTIRPRRLERSRALALLLLPVLLWASTSIGIVAQVTDGLIAHWALDEGTGTSTFDAISNTSAALQGAATWTTGRVGGAVLLDGSTGYIAPSSVDVFGPGLTLAAWLNINNYPGSAEQRVIAKANSADDASQYWSLSLVKQGGRNLLRFRLKTGTTTSVVSASTGELPAKRWYHAAATYDGTTMRLYVDGKEVGSAAKSGTVATNASVPVNIGKNPNGSNFLRGSIDDVRIYNRGLSAAEIAAVMSDPGSSGGSDTTAPSVPANVQATAASSTQVNVQWTASTDNKGVTGYKVRRNGTVIATATSTAHTDTGVVASTTYNYTVSAVDAAGNESAQSAAVSVTTPAGQTNKPPSVSLTAPANGASFTAPATVTMTANASDPENRLTQVQFYAGGTLLGSDTTAPYSFTWSSVPAGSYTITAVARDADGASTTSAPVMITVGTPQTTLWKVAFTASADHDTKVSSYLLEIFAATADPNTAAPLQSSDLGKPAPDANRDIIVDRTTLYQGLATGSYKLTVRSMGANGSTRSTAVAFTK